MTLRTIVIVSALALPAIFCQAGSAKRGVCWDESTRRLEAHHAALLSPGVSWAYNWGPDAAVPAAYSADFAFQPMAWNGAYNATRIRTWLAAHPETRYLLGFNEPNFADQARMTPAEAAKAWPALEAIAEEFGLKLVAPALNFSNSKVGDRVWSPYEWYDEFFRLYPTAKVDLLAMHSYMNWYSANTWLATEYFYADLYNSRKECYGRYPNLVKFLDDYKAANGHFPKMMLTEFCSWENDGSITGVDFQIDQMTQKVQKLELSELVEGYAWFMANPSGGASAYPYMSLLQSNTATSALSELGTVYVYMSTFDKERFYAPSELIAAKDYVDATTDNTQVHLRKNTDASSALPLQVQFPSGSFADYLIDVPSDGTYLLTIRAKADADGSLIVYIDNKKTAQTAVNATAGTWIDLSVELSLKAGHHTLTPYNGASGAITLNAMTFSASDGIANIGAQPQKIVNIYTIGGTALGGTETTELPAGCYIVRYADGTTCKFVK